MRKCLVLAAFAAAMAITGGATAAEVEVKMATFAGKNGEDVVVKFDQAGIYGVNCTPHYGMGMVAMVVFGTPANEEQARGVPQTGKAKQVFAVLFDKLAATKTAAK